MNNIKLSISIMHCSWNKERVKMLSEAESKINKSLLNGFEISDDVDKNGVWWNCKQAWNMIPEDSTHHIVLQDDMIPCDNFVETLLELIKNNSDNIIHIFGSTDSSKVLNENGYNWFISYDGSWGGSILLPRKHFKWYEECDQMIIDAPRLYDDFKFNVYCMINQHKIYNVTPTLLTHKGYDKSLIGHNNDFMMSKHVINTNPLNINWKLPKEIKFGLIYFNQLCFAYSVLKENYKNILLNKFNSKDLKQLNVIQEKLHYYNIYPELKRKKYTPPNPNKTRKNKLE